MDSACSDEPVSVVTAEGSNAPTPDNPVLNVTISGSTQGWSYMKVNDPMNNVYPILKIIRPDGKVMSHNNYWMQENTIYFVDYEPSDAYTIVYKVPLIVNNLSVSNITTESERINWTTDRLSDSLIKYGTRSGIYTLQKRNATNVIAHSIKLNELAPNTTYYYVINSTHPSGNSNQSFEYSFSTGEVADTTPPASATDLHNITYAPNCINWTWTDPADLDFDHTEVFIDGIPNGSVQICGSRKAMSSTMLQVLLLILNIQLLQGLWTLAGISTRHG
jgi:hypothetical protein